MFPHLVVFKLHFQWDSLFQLNLTENPDETQNRTVLTQRGWAQWTQREISALDNFKRLR